MTRDQDASDTLELRQFGGVVCLLLAISIAGLMMIEDSQGLPFAMPPTWYNDRPVWVLAIVLLLGASWRLQRARGDGQMPWQPSSPGRRFAQLVVYSRADCHLCDDAKQVLARYREFLPELQQVDIASDTALEARWGAEIPVVEIDGRVRFRGHVDELLLQRLIEGTPPGDEFERCD